jgi:hypothetical protein
MSKYEICQVTYNPLDEGKEAYAEVRFRDIGTDYYFMLPIAISSMALLPAPKQLELEKKIKELEATIAHLAMQVQHERDLYSRLINEKDAECKKKIKELQAERDLLRDQVHKKYTWSSTTPIKAPTTRPAQAESIVSERVDKLEKRVKQLEDYIYPTITIGKSDPVPIYDLKITVGPTPVPEDGYTMDTAPTDKETVVLLFMGGRWLRGRRSLARPLWWSTGVDSQSITWDEQNQPTRWKPLSKE